MTYSQALLSRRRYLFRAAGLGLGCACPLGMWPRDMLAGETSEELGFGRAKSVIVVFASGGQSQFETWDPKPMAPAEVRGAFDAIETAVPGTYISEHLPRLARLANRYSIIRNMSHEDLDHGSAFYLSMTGRYHRRRSANPLPSADDLPCCGAVLQRVRPTSSFVQTAVHLNGPAEVPLIVGPGQFGGFLGKGFDPLTLGDVTATDIAIPALQPHVDVATGRLNARQTLLEEVEQAAGRLNRDQRGRDKETLYAQAFEMLMKDSTRSAFDLSRESESLRERYGRHRAGQACLLSRRLVEAGVPLITVIWNHNNRGQDLDPNDSDLYGWDTHNDIFTSLQNHLLPRFDQSFSALLEDLEQRGLLETTLVICLGEFGRAPIVALEKNFAGGSPGRKHWSWVYSILMAGAGVAQGKVIGASDSRGAYPVSNPYGPWDVTATLFNALGIDPHAHYEDLQGRPYALSDGKAIRELYG